MRVDVLLLGAYINRAPGVTLESFGVFCAAAEIAGGLRKVRQVFDLSPAGIIRDLNLLRPIYADTSSLGHFGPWRDPAVYLWEQPDRCKELRRSFEAHHGGAENASSR